LITAPTEAPAGHGLLERMSQARERSDALFQVVHPDALYDRPIAERHRIIFYLGHLEAFDWNLLHERWFGLKSFHPELDRLFAFGIDPVGGGLPSDKPSDWPAAETVREYVRAIRSALDRELAERLSGKSAAEVDGFSADTLLNVAVEHRLMHAETLAYMLHQLPFDRKSGSLDPPLDAPALIDHGMVAIPSGRVVLGLPRDAGLFGWDNEFEAHKANVPAFEIDRYKVTNAQYLDFVAAGGYDAPEFWSDEDWTWKSAYRITHPVFWVKRNGRWLYRGMFGEIPLPLNWPVYLSHAEASTYARWAGKSLPTEEEWQRAAYGTPEGIQRDYSERARVFDLRHGNFDFKRWDPAPVNAFPGGQSAFGVHDMLGNGWEWTSTVFAPFVGFEPFPFYRGYSADFFDGKHFVMKGGSTRTAACMVRPSFRNWFQSHYQYVYAGFRCVQH
jgi:ergothioneine biosynthesis protein EgtB